MVDTEPKLLCKTKTYDCYSNYFNTPLSLFTNIEKISTYIEKVKKIEDPILQYISLYLGEFFETAKNDFTGKKNNDNACWSLNRWLDQMKNIYTSAKFCKTNESIWDKYIEGDNGLWNLLKNRDSTTKLCNRTFTTTVTFPTYIASPECHKHVPQEYICYSPEEKPCPQQDIIREETPFLASHPPPQQQCTIEHVPSLEAQVSCDVNFVDSKIFVIGFSVFSTISGVSLILFILYKFTPLVSWLYNRRMKNRKLQYFREEELYESSMYENNYAYSNNRRNYLHYPSIQN
ncbi:PIR Superfamily Protein [Plasmodium ovale curtisi]|uniref:PIR Superfamily Protein n=1 Tax=Plasmodium ovale curtisi TaxID=864141 RepID=A0A1A8WLM6_PLAOA|nr:PIR Superfamily Protein [Plasmodium ovale curtisi]SBT01761.1 PIR Superfamily Protein [Plasmodium ovale curtisi]